MLGPVAYVAFLGVSLLVICTPGQDTALTIRNTLLGGRRAGAATAAGVACGQAVWTLVTAAGLSALLLASAPLFLAVKLAGAAYLVYLGARSLIRALLREDGPDRAAAAAAASRPRLGARAALLQGVLSNLTNAKMVAFFIGLLPPFAGPHPMFELLLALGLNFCLLTFAWLALYTLAVDAAGGWLTRRAARRALDGAMGAVLLGLGIRVGAEALERA